MLSFHGIFKWSYYSLSHTYTHTYIHSMCMVLHQHDHHGHGHGHSHGHNRRRSHSSDQHGQNHKSWWHKLTGRRHDHDGEGEEGNIRKRQTNNKKEGHSINVRAAFIHVIGDLIQSIGVVIAGYIIKFWVSIKTYIVQCLLPSLSHISPIYI